MSVFLFRTASAVQQKSKFRLRELAKKSTEPDLAKNAFDIKEYFRNWAAAVEIIIYCFK